VQLFLANPAQDIARNQTRQEITYMTANPAFLALMPDSATNAFIADAKTIVRRVAGNQRYLDDPPHLTLFVGCFVDLDAVGTVIATSAAGWSMPTANIAGWHVFRDDPITGGHTLVCGITAETATALRHIQDLAISVAGPLRNTAATLDRYSPRIDRFSEVQRASLERCGFPFTGSEWRPHISIASIVQRYWDAAWAALGSTPRIGTVSFPVLHWYRLVDEHPVLLREIVLSES